MWLPGSAENDSKELQSDAKLPLILRQPRMLPGSVRVLLLFMFLHDLEGWPLILAVLKKNSFSLLGFQFGD